MSSDLPVVTDGRALKLDAPVYYHTRGSRDVAVWRASRTVTTASASFPRHELIITVSKRLAEEARPSPVMEPTVTSIPRARRLPALGRLLRKLMHGANVNFVDHSGI